MSPDHRRRPWRVSCPEGEGLSLSPNETPTRGTVNSETKTSLARRRFSTYPPHEIVAYTTLLFLVSLFVYVFKRVMEGPEGMRWRARHSAEILAVSDMVPALLEPLQRTSFLVSFLQNERVLLEVTEQAQRNARKYIAPCLSAAGSARPHYGSCQLYEAALRKSARLCPCTGARPER